MKRDKYMGLDVHQAMTVVAVMNAGHAQPKLLSKLTDRVRLRRLAKPLYGMDGV
jgi:hypothetical protein